MDSSLSLFHSLSVPVYLSLSLSRCPSPHAPISKLYNIDFLPFNLITRSEKIGVPKFKESLVEYKIQQVKI